MTDGNGCVASDCEYVTNGNQNTGCSTYAAFTNVDSFYTFSTSTIGGNPVYWSWYIDNVLVDSTASFSTVIASGSNSTVCVEIIDANGLYCQDCIYLTTSPGTFSCQAYFVIYPDSSAGITGYYTGLNLSSANQPVFWDFGDGNTSTNPYPSHTYAQPGNYIICLTVGSPNTLCYDTYCDSSFYVFKTEGGLMTQLTIESPTGINELTNNSNLKIYPNPATSELNISSDFTIERIRIYNFQGQVAQETHSTTTSMNIATLSSGVYIVEVTGGKQISRSKLIKQ